jgi:hypothetical protein
VETLALLGSVTGLGLMAGLRLYATVLAVGLGVRFGLVHLDPAVAHLAVLASTPILITAGIAYLLEFIGDKIPWVDSLWDSVHTFIRPLGAAVLGATAISSVDTATQVLTVLLCGGAAVASHSMKAGTRVLVNHSPEPVSNISLSLFDDVLAPLGAWFSLQHPQLMLAAAVIFLVFFLWVSPRFFRLLKVEVCAFRALIKRYTFGSDPASLRESMPPRYESYLGKRFDPAEFSAVVRCVASKGIGRLRHSIGYLCVGRDGLLFLTRRWFRFSMHRSETQFITNLQRTKGSLLDFVSFRDAKGERSFYFFKNSSDRGMRALGTLSRSGKSEAEEQPTP